MTKESLAKLGLYYTGWGNQYSIAGTDERVIIPPKTTREELFTIVWESGFEYGKKIGHREKCIEIKKVLDIHESR